MKTQKNHRSLIILLILGSVFLLSAACNRGPLGSVTDSSKDRRSDPVLPPGTDNKALTYCSGNTNEDASMKVSSIVYFDTQGRYVGDHIRAKITKLPPIFSNPGVKLKFFRWKVSTDGVPFLDETPLTFGLQRKDGQISGGDRTVLEGAELSAATGSPNLDSFSADWHFIVRGTTADWEVLKAVVYAGETMITEVNLLMPAFTADPNVYSSKNPALLSSLHPNNSSAGGTWTDDDYLSMLDSYCFYNVGNI